MLQSMFRLILFIFSFGLIFSNEYPKLKIEGINPNAGPEYGETRVTVRLSELDIKLTKKYPTPKCRFGNKNSTVTATYIKCTSTPIKIGEKEVKSADMCDDSPKHKEGIVPLTISVLGDFSDVVNSLPFRYYENPVVEYVYPRYGPKNGDTFVEIFGKNFLNFDQNLRCAFGSKTVQAYYVDNDYIICYSPQSEVTGVKLPFSVSFNDQQYSKEEISYVYYFYPQIFSIEPNKGPDDGGTRITLKGQNLNPLNEISGMSNVNDTFCSFGNLTYTNATVISSTEMQCDTPPSYDLRYHEVEVTLNGRDLSDNKVKFYYYHPPYVYQIKPKIGPIAGKTNVTVIGSNFENTGYVKCKFGKNIVNGYYINQNEIKCISPTVLKPEKIPLSIAIRPDEFSSGISTIYRYYDDPIVDSIEPACGPEKGLTQITVIGKKFPDKDSEYIKCVFNGTILKNATVMNDTHLICDSPNVLNEEGENYKNVDFYSVELTLNGLDISGPAKKFYYYEEPEITGIYPRFGSIQGNTPLNVTGLNLNQKNACDIRLKFSTFDVKPEKKFNNSLLVLSPPANYSGSVTVELTLNGKDYVRNDEDHFRDNENTFYYYKFPIITDIIPAKGPTTGGTKIDILGLNLNAPFYGIPIATEKLVFYKFVDSKNSSIQYGEVKSAKADSNSLIKIESPPVFKDKTETLIELSYNQFDFETIPKETFIFYLLPNITSIEPKFGPVILKEDKIKIHLDNYICTENCEKILCKFSSKSLYLIEKGYFIKKNLIHCDLPTVNSPDLFIVEISLNDGQEYTNNQLSYTFFRPYVLKVEPPMIPSSGNSKILIQGYGFANTGDDLIVKFGGNNLKCKNSDCIRKAKYINENLIEVLSFPRLEFVDFNSNKTLDYSRFPVEVSVYNNDFTNNNYTIFYYEEPIIINNYSDSDFVGDEQQRSEMEKSSIKTLPANVDTFISLSINSNKILKDFEKINQYATYSCKFEKTNNSSIYKITEGLISSIPKNSKLKNLYFCQSPEWNNIGEYIIKISLNGNDYSETYFDINFTDPLEIFHIDPPCGPLEGSTKVDLYGTGFENFEDFTFKWGVSTLVPMKENSFLDFINSNKTSPKFLEKYKSEFPIKKITINSPIGYSNFKTVGGPSYIYLTKMNSINYYNTTDSFDPFEYIHSNHEFYHYKQPYIQAINPRGAIVTGGTDVIVYGGWFDYRPNFGVIPFCKFGNKIVEGKFISTVRILCTSPVYETPNIKVPFEVSLNGRDFTDFGLKFIFYNDFRNAKFNSIEPLSGPQTGGTQINLYGKNFTNLVDPEEFLCQFKSEDSNIPPKFVPAGFRHVENSSESVIICNSPGGWKSGTKASILITFDGRTYMDTGFDFYFYKVDHIVPLSGPNQGNGPIQVYGSGFKDTGKVKCILDGITSNPVDIKENLVKCPMHSPKKNNYTGTVEFGVILNGIDINMFNEGFYFYDQPIVNEIFPKYGPSKGKAIVKIFGENFQNNFKNANPSCKIGNYRGRAEIKSPNLMNCEFNHLPLIPVNKTMNFSLALNNYSFTEEFANNYFIPYGITKITPSSGPIKGGSRIEVLGSGFFSSKKARCRFGTPGYFFYTQAEIINYNQLICMSPTKFIIPKFADLPFSVPFSIAFNDDEFNPWTETSHYFTFYNNAHLSSISPTEGKTFETTEISIFATSPIIITEDNVDYTYSEEGTIKSVSSFTYQPITCKFGYFGVTQGVYFNRTLIKCLSPIDSELGYEDVNIEISLNGEDYFYNPDIVFTLIGPAAGRMLWIYIIISILTTVLMLILVLLIVSYWNRLNLSNRDDNRGGQNAAAYLNRPRYVVDQSRQNLHGDLLHQDSINSN